MLFVCIENSCRSQMAEAVYNRHARNSTASSAGSKPAATIEPNTVEVLKEIGLDVSGKKPQGYAPHQAAQYDYVVTMGCKEACPITPKEKTIKWEIPDPKGKPNDEIRKTRDLIEQKVLQLIREVEKT